MVGKYKQLFWLKQAVNYRIMEHSCVVVLRINRWLAFFLEKKQYWMKFFYCFDY